MMRSCSGMNRLSTFSIVVLPVAVPPDTRMLSLPRTQASSTSARSSDIDPNPIRSWAVKGSSENRRIVRHGPCTASGGTMALTRDPSGSRASTIGEDSSTRRPTAETIFSMTLR